MGRAVVKSVSLHTVLIVLAVACFVPFIWLICATLKGKEDFFTYTFLPWERLTHRQEVVDPTIQPPPFVTFENYKLLFQRKPFANWMVNSLFITATHTAIVVTLSSLGGFALAKYRFIGRRALMALMLLTMLLPSQVLLPSAWLLMYKIGWLNSYKALIIPGAVSVFGMFLFMQAMKSVPDELLQAGRVDGCSELRLWWEVALPIVRPMIGAYTLLSFMATWNSFLWPQVVLQSADKYSLPIGLANMIGLPAYDTPYGMLMAGTLLSILPVVILFFILQRDFIAGLASGAVKG
jgi:ABC-type glycerol-3-phosphate transport system permease component